MGRRHHRTVALLTLCLLAIAACGEAPAEGPPPRTDLTTPASEVFFPTLIPRSTDLPDALGIGTLIVDRRGCLRLRSIENTATPLWPPGFEVLAGEGGLRVVDGQSRLRAKVGEKVRLGGGYTRRSRLEDYGVPLEKKVARKLFERCPGWYFLTQEYGTKLPR